MTKNNTTTTITIMLIIAILGFFAIIPAYSQLPYFPKIQSSSEKTQNSMIIKANESDDNNYNSIASIPKYSYGNTASSNSSSQSSNDHNNSKVVIINFDDSHKSQYTYAKPILDKYGFKATFFEVCNWVEAGHHNSDMTTTWKDIAALQQDGIDIEAHTMNHPHINGSLSSADLDYEIGQSQQCLINHGINSTIFAYPYGEGSNNSAVVNTVAKYYNLARTDSKSALTFLHCDGGGSSIGNNNEKINHTDCRAYFSNGTLTPANRYSINSWAHRHIERDCSVSSSSRGTCTVVRQEYNNSQMFEKFITAVNMQNNYNRDGIVRAIPIIIYHTIVTYPDLSYSNRPVDTTLNLFDAEMKYLHDNGFKVLTMADLAYDENNNYLYIKTTNHSNFP
ncbi:MAG: polysaccharide deacetylase family protein [Nitrososphaeraceae archaeon]